MILELRRYHLQPNAEARMHRRMAADLLPMFAETGVPRPAAIWMGGTADAPVLSWILQWESFEQRRATWINVAPVWQRVKAERAEAEFVTRTELTLMEPWPDHLLAFGGPIAACESVWHVQPAVGHGGAVRALCLEREIPTMRDLGAISVFAVDLVFGALPQIRLFVSWPNPDARAAGIASLNSRLPRLQGVDCQYWETLDRGPVFN